MEAVRFARNVLSFSVPDNTSQWQEDVAAPSMRRRISALFGVRRRHRRMSLYRACSLSLSDDRNNNLYGRQTPKAGAYQVTRTRRPPQLKRVQIPLDATPGSDFVVRIEGHELLGHCPTNLIPGINCVHIMVPGEPVTRQTMLKMAELTKSKDNKTIRNRCITQVDTRGTQDSTAAITKTMTCLATEKPWGVKVKIPKHVQEGMTFLAVVDEVRYEVTCPASFPRNRKIRFFPVTRNTPEDAHPFVAGKARKMTRDTFIEDESDTNEKTIMLKYDESISHGWMRVLSEDGNAFQWVPVPALNVNETYTRSAWCPSLSIMAGKDRRLPAGNIDLVAPEDAITVAQIQVNKKEQNIIREKLYFSTTTYSPQDIAGVQAKSLNMKSNWFRGICNELVGSWDHGNIKLVVRRENLLEDSLRSVMSLSPQQMRQPWRFEFIGEMGIDSGGVTREWFQLITEDIMRPALGLWKAGTNQTYVSINPDSATACAGDHLMFFRFTGRVLGRALFDQQVVTAHLVPFLYKYLLGWPLTLQDLRDLDTQFYDSLQKLKDTDDMSALCLDFTVTEHTAGKLVSVELIPGGADMAVTMENLDAYMEAQLRYRFLHRIRSQLQEISLGFLDVVPAEALVVFDPKELSLVLCGLPTIEVNDWRANSTYSGTFADEGEDSEIVRWFWNTVNNFEQETRARLLQFVTGSAGVPSQGFGALQGSNGEIKRFTIIGTEADAESYPKAHTCFNTLDLPRYKSEKQLCSKLTSALALSGIGFGIN